MSAGGEEMASLRSWQDFVCECFCFGSEAVKASGEAMRGLVKSRVEFSLVASPLANSLEEKWRFCRLLAHKSRQLCRLRDGLQGCYCFLFFCLPDEHKNPDWSD